MSAPEGVGRRYLATLAAQVVRLGYSIVAAIIVPRALGPVAYGNYNFVLATAATLRSCVDNSTQQAFFTFSSQQRESGSLTRVYALVLAVQFALVMGLIAIAWLTGTTHYLWHDQDIDAIVWVTLVDWAVFLALSLQQLGDSKGLSVRVQAIGALAALLMLVALLTLFALDRLDFRAFVFVNLGGALFTCALLVRWLLVDNAGLTWRGAAHVSAYARRWWSFARPLLLVQYYLPVVAWLGIYLVQRWYGSAEQGYYALALQWSAIGLVFTNAALALFWREIAFHTATGDRERAGVMYEKLSGGLVFLALVLACGLCAASDTLVPLVSGPEFLPAVGVVAVMAFYPVAQTLGQLTTAALKATERTRTYAFYSVGLSIPDLALTYFLLAPPTAAVPGLGLGAIGLAIKIALYGLLSVQIYDWINRRHLGISRLSPLGHRVVSLLVVGPLAWATLRLGTHALLGIGAPPAVALALAGVAYGLALVALVLWRPAIAHLTRAQLAEAANMLLRRDSRT